MKQVHGLLVALALASASLHPTAAESADAVIGETPMALSDGSSLAKSSDESVLRFARKTLTPEKRLLVVWTDRGQGAPQEPYYPVRHRYAVAYTMSALESRDATPGNFAQVKRAIREDVADLQAGSGGNMPESLTELRADLRARGIDPDSGISVGPAAIQLLSENELQLSHLILQPVAIPETNGQLGQGWLLACTNALLIRGKIVTVNVFSLFADSADREWVTSECGELVRSLQAANP